ncbi:hypothetical protein FX991_05595 [Latilactobacillus sakei]|uniref:hypothetical protein n=1 Tax=Latilactobacillus sakei TaxID=1599 RepID=UPI001F4BD79E|nr:hypothetical protein [Latilactobacillus sakei]UNC19621.1 hypothetical protein FX991_05595 [Latilactobacillus sakei]
MKNNYIDKRKALINWINGRRYLLEQAFPVVGHEFEETNTPKLFNELSADEQAVLVNWVLTTLKPIKTFSGNRTSYEIKHIFERTPLGFYVLNGAMKGAMLIAGYQIKNEKEINWTFNISERSISRAYQLG